MTDIAIPPPLPAADAALVLGVAGLNDPATWVDAHGDVLYRYALARVRDASAAEDLVQETLLAALQSQDRFGGRCSEQTWLVGILRHKIGDHFRRTRRELAPGTDDVDDIVRASFRDEDPWRGHWRGEAEPGEWGDDPEAAFVRAEFWEALERGLQTVTERNARAFWLREVEGRSTEEICKELGVTATNLGVILFRTRMELRHHLERDWFEGRAVTHT